MSLAWGGADPTGFVDSNAYELGTRFRALATVTVSAIRVWSPGGLGFVDRRARVWSAETSTVLRVLAIDDVLPAGWSTFDLVTPLVLSAGDEVVASYSTRDGYGAIPGALSSGDVVSADSLMMAPQDVGTAHNGGYSTTPGTFPDDGTGTFYGLDLVYSAGDTTGSNQPPTASLAATVDGLDVTFTATAADEDPGSLTYSFAFGDGAGASGASATVSHTYAPGVYAATVVVEDLFGLSAVAAVPVVVAAPLPATSSVRFPDGQRAGRDALRAALSGRTEPEALGVTVGTRRPSWAADEAPAKPYVMVRLDGAGRTASLDGTALLRVTVWHTDEGLALALASLCEALLLGASDDAIRSVGSAASPVPADDPETGDPLAFFRVTAHLRPLPVTT